MCVIWVVKKVEKIMEIFRNLKRFFQGGNHYCKKGNFDQNLAGTTKINFLKIFLWNVKNMLFLKMYDL